MYFYGNRNIVIKVFAIEQIFILGENKNTGADHGFLRRVELMLGRPLMFLICIFHMLELVFRALFEVIDGKAKGPENYSGPIGKDTSKI